MDQHERSEPGCDEHERTVTSAAIDTRAVLHQIAAHVLGRRRDEVSGRFGLRASPGGFATPAFGDGPEVIRTSGVLLVREVGGGASSISIPGSTLRELADFAGTDIDRPFAVGSDTPAIDAPDAVLDVDAIVAGRLAAWLQLGWTVLDEVVASLGEHAEPATIQLWPEHFDAATNVVVASGQRVNLGFCLGDSYDTEPYAYVGPWGPERGGDPDYWNAPFGAVLRSEEVGASSDPHARCVEFMTAGLAHAVAPPDGGGALKTSPGADPRANAPDRSDGDRG